MPVIDAHQHLWDVERVDYPYFRTVPLLDRTYRESELEPSLDLAGIDHTVLVQAMDSAADTEYMLEVAERWPRVAGIVGWVDLTHPDEAAGALDRYTRDARFVGVRHLIHEEPDTDWLRRRDIQEGLTMLAERGLTFDVVAVMPRHLEHVVWLADRHPGLRMVIDHLGKPPIAAGGWEPWASLLRATAQAMNVSAKVSGLNTAARWTDWTIGDLRPYVAHAIEVFGPHRLMYGGDWPVTDLAGGYRKVWDATSELVADLDETDRAWIMGRTAASIYRLPLDPPHGSPTPGWTPVGRMEVA